MFDAEGIADRLAIRELMDLYGLAVDQRAWELYRQVFTPDAIIDYQDSGGMREDVDTTVTWLDQGLAVFSGLHHNMTNHVCEIEGDTARACTYFLAYHTMPDGHGGEDIMSLGGFYQDRLARSDRWRITERVELGVWLGGSAPAAMPTPAWQGGKEHWKPALPLP